MAQPFFADLGKQCSGLFSGGYVHDTVKIDVKVGVESGAEFNFGGVNNLAKKTVSGGLICKYKFEEPSATILTKWNTENIFGSEGTVEEFVKGGKLGYEFTFQPQKQKPPPQEAGGSAEDKEAPPVWVLKKMSKFKGSYKNEIGTVNFESELRSNDGPLVDGPFLRGGCSVGSGQYFTAGIGLGYDLGGEKFTEKKIGFQVKPWGNNDVIGCCWYCLKGSVFTTSIYHKLGEVEYGWSAQWSFSENKLGLGLGVRQKFDDETTLRAKIDEKANIAFGFTHTLKKGFDMTLSALMNCREPFSGTFAAGGAFEINL